MKKEEHKGNTEIAWEEKKKDKERAKSDKYFAAVTFDLEDFLPTPCTMVGDLFDKRCLSTYNLSFYSLGDGKCTCYFWDETNGGRGSSDIGSCVLMHINSIAEKSSTICEITYYSDTFGGQNRNQFVASVMLYALQSWAFGNNHKFFERVHSEMKADFIHSFIERAKRSTKVYHPSQWDTVVSMARTRNPYIVIPLNYRLSRFKSIINRSEYEFEKSKVGRNDHLAQGEMETGYKRLSCQHIFQLQFWSGKFYGLAV